jgi:hypothetical protein
MTPFIHPRPPATTILSLLLITAACHQLKADSIWVSPNGADSNPGTRSLPLKTLKAAQSALEHHPMRGKTPLTVHCLPGTYYLNETLVFQPQHSGSKSFPVILRSTEHDRAVISGGNKLDLHWKQISPTLWQASTPKDLEIDQLFVNGQRQHMARYPNFDPTSQYFQGYSANATSPERISRWKNPSGGYLHAMHSSLWGDMHWLITGKTPSNTLDMVGGWQNNRQMGAHAEYRFVENILEELDASGEWFHNPATSTLYFIPPPDLDLASATIETAQLTQLINFLGSPDQPVHDIQLQGFKFQHAKRSFMDNREPLLRSDWTTSRSGACYFRNAESCSIQDCSFDQLGGNGVFVDGYNRNIQILRNHFKNTGASAVSLVGRPHSLRSPLLEYHQTQPLDAIDKTPGPKSNDYPASCLIEDCLIVAPGRVEKQTAGVNIAIADSITVRHCSIYECPRAGINICDGSFGGHLIEGNDVFDTVLETGDHGSFNSWGRDRFWHPDRKVTEQWVSQYPDMPKWECQKTITLRDNRFRCDHGWDIDLDDGSSNYVIANNLCLAGGIKLREGYFRTVTNNIIVNWSFCPHVWYANSHSTFTRNIIWQDTYHPAGMNHTDQPALINSNFVHQANAVTSPASGLTRFGGDQHSLLGDARFIDPVQGNYALQSNSPAITLGFIPFDTSRFGVRPPQLKAIARQAQLPGTLEAATLKSGGWDREYKTPITASWRGITLQNLHSPAEMSAFGLARNQKGLLVTAINPNSITHKNGIQNNDVILQINQTPTPSLAELGDLLKTIQPAAPLTLTIWRNQSSLTISFQP